MTIAAIAFLDHADTRFAVTVERTALAALGGGCQVPIGVYCRRLPTEQEPAVYGWVVSQVEVFAVVADPDTGAAVRIYHRAALEENDPMALGKLAAQMLIEAGARPLLEAAGGDSK